MFKIVEFNDIDTIVNIEKQCFLNDFWSKNSIENELRLGHLYWIYCVEDRFVGYGGFIPILDECEITRIAILPEFQKKGYGNELFKYICEQAKALNYTKIFLEVSEINVPAKTIYLKNGFEIYNIRKNYYKDNSDALLMTKML